MYLMDDKQTLEKVNDVVKYVNTIIAGDGAYDNNWFSYRESVNRYTQYDTNDTAFVYNDKYMLICIDDKYFFAYCDDGKFFFDPQDSEFNCLSQRNSSYIADLIIKMNDYLVHNGYPEHAIKCADPLFDKPEFLKNIESFALTDKDEAYIKEWNRKRHILLEEIIMCASDVIKTAKKVITSCNKKLNNEKFQANAMQVIKDNQIEKIKKAEEVIKKETERLEKAKELLKQLKRKTN